MTTVYGHKQSRNSAYNFSSEDLEKYCDFVGYGKDGVEEWRLKPQYRESKGQKVAGVALAALSKIFGG